MFAPGVTIQYRMQSFLVMQLWKKYRTGSFAVVWKYPIVDGWFVFWLVGWLVGSEGVTDLEQFDVSMRSWCLWQSDYNGCAFLGRNDVSYMREDAHAVFRPDGKVE